MSHKISVYTAQTQPCQANKSKRFVRTNSINSSSSHSKFQAKPSTSKSSRHITLNPEEHRTVQVKVTKLQPSDYELNSQEVIQPLEIIRSGMQQRGSSFRLKKDNENCKRNVDNKLEQVEKLFYVEKENNQIKIKHLEKTIQLKNLQCLELVRECSKLKQILKEERKARNKYSEQVKQCQRQINNLNRKAQKYRLIKIQLQQQQQKLNARIKELEEEKSQQSSILNSYRQKSLEQEVTRLKLEIAKDRSSKEEELQICNEYLRQEKYQMFSKFKTLEIANEALHKQLKDIEKQAEELRRSLMRGVTYSQQYVELRQKYRLLLAEFRQLKQEVEDRDYSEKNQKELTVLTISECSYRQ